MEAVHPCHQSGVSAMAVCAGTAVTVSAHGQLRTWSAEFGSHLLEVSVLPLTLILLEACCLEGKRKKGSKQKNSSVPVGTDVPALPFFECIPRNEFVSPMRGSRLQESWKTLTDFVSAYCKFKCDC